MVEDESLKIEMMSWHMNKLTSFQQEAKHTEDQKEAEDDYDLYDF